MFDEKVEAFMLLVVEHGADEEVLEGLMEIKGVAEASLVLGEYDIHCKLNVEGMEKMKDVIAEVRKLRILTSETLVAYKKAPRVKKVTNNHIRRLGHRRARH